MATAQPKTAPTVQNTASAGTGCLRYKLIRENVGAISDKQIPPKNNEEFVSKNQWNMKKTNPKTYCTNTIHQIQQKGKQI